MHGSLHHALAAICLTASTIAAAQSSVIHPRVVVVAYFEVGADTGDQPGELQFWVERDHLDSIIQVPGMSRAVRANAEGSELAITIGPGNINPAVNLMAFAADPRFDLRQTHWLIAGIAGISPSTEPSAPRSGPITSSMAIWPRRLTRVKSQPHGPTVSSRSTASRRPIRQTLHGKTMCAHGAEPMPAPIAAATSSASTPAFFNGLMD